MLVLLMVLRGAAAHGDVGRHHAAAGTGDAGVHAVVVVRGYGGG